MKDLLGRDFKLGDRIAYGGRAGSHGYMAVGTVDKLNDQSLTVTVVTHSGFRGARGGKSVVQRPERAVILA